MRLCWSSASYWPQTKVTLFVKSISLVLVLGLFLGLDTVAVHSSPVQVHRNTQQLHYCDYTSTGKVYDIADLLKCMNELAFIKNDKRQERSTDGKVQFFPTPTQSEQYPQQSQYPQLLDNYAPNNLRRGPSYPSINPGYYKYPPALPPGYPLTSDSSSTPGILGINLVDALSSISQYDDLKCVPRIICEVAAGVIPGNSVYKQNNADTGMNALISLLTAVNSGDTSPLLNFGKSALMGYANRGNSEICYRQYSKCPRNPEEVVNYLNNHNGGFFRFFNRNSGLGYRVNVNNEAVSPSHNSVSDRKGTGELKFDTTTPRTRSKSLNFHDNKDDAKSIRFPDEPRYHNRLIRSFNYDFQNRGVTREKSNFFPQDRMDQNIADQLYYLSQSQLNNENQQRDSYNKSKVSEAKLYLLDNVPSENHKRFVFPDGQSVMIDIGFSKLFNEGYENMLKRGFIMNDIPQSINFEGLSVINLPELYTQDGAQQYIQVIHPCDMICHDTRGTAIQFNQIVDSHGSLSTIMIPERPIVDLSQPLPCTIICLNRNGERQQLSTTLNKVLRANYNGKHEVNKSTVRFKRVPSESKIIKPRFVGDTFPSSYVKPTHERNLPEVPQMTSPMGQSFIYPIGGGANWPAVSSFSGNPWQSQFPSRENPPSSRDDGSPLDGVAMGENPLAVAITIEPPSGDSSPGSGDTQTLPATVIMCGGFMFFLPVTAQTIPLCGTPIDTYNIPTARKIIYQPRNLWGNYTDFFENYGNVTDNLDAVTNVTDSPKPIEETTTVTTPYTPTTIAPPIVTKPPIPIDQPVVTPAPDHSDDFEYEQATSCLDGESWDIYDHQCVPITYHRDAEYEYPAVPGYSWEKIPVKKREDERQKILIRTPDADMYIEG